MYLKRTAGCQHVFGLLQWHRHSAKVKAGLYGLAYQYYNQNYKPKSTM